MGTLTEKLNVKNLYFSYQNQMILNDLSFNVIDIEFLSIIGPSGCGKTTLLKVLCGVLFPNSGTIMKDGIDITSLMSSKRKIGVVFQDAALFNNMNVLKNVKYALNKVLNEKNSLDKAKLMLEKVGLSDCLNKFPEELSIGQRQRVAIARTLVMNPEIIIFDEPLSALDAYNKIKLRKLIKKIQLDNKTTIIYITHDQEDAFTLSDRIMILSEKNMHQIDSPEIIINSPKDNFVNEFFVQTIFEKAKVYELIYKCCN